MADFEIVDAMPERTRGGWKIVETPEIVEAIRSGAVLRFPLSRWGNKNSARASVHNFARYYGVRASVRTDDEFIYVVRASDAT